MANVAHEPVKKAMSRIRELSADEETRRLAFVRERALRDEVSLLNDARREGAQLILQRLLTKRFGDLPEWVIQKLDAANARQLEGWTDEILVANSLDELFKHIGAEGGLVPLRPDTSPPESDPSANLGKPPPKCAEVYDPRC